MSAFVYAHGMAVMAGVAMAVWNICIVHMSVCDIYNLFSFGVNEFVGSFWG
jgi:hypothetical protein